MSLDKRVARLEQEVAHLKNLGTPRQQDAASVKPDNAPAEENDAASGKLALLPKVKPAPKNSQQTDKPWYKTFNGWKARFEVAAIIGGLFYAGITFRQWRDLRHNFQIEQRAWLTFKFGPLPDIAGLYAVDNWPGTIANVGKSPAIRIAATYKLEILDKGQSPSLAFAKAQQDLIPILFPGDPLTVTVLVEEPASMDITPRKLSPEEVSRLASGQAYLAAFVIVVYEDQFGPHWTRVCTYKAFKQGTYPTGKCVTQGNTVGDGPPPSE